MNKGLKKDVETLNDSFSQYQVMRKAIEKSGTLVTKLSKYYNFMLGDEECNEEYYQAIYDTDFDVDIFEAEVIDEMAKLLIALHVLMLSMNSKKRGDRYEEEFDIGYYTGIADRKYCLDGGDAVQRDRYQ